MKLTTVACLTKAEAILERIVHLAEQLALAPVNSKPHRALSVAIRIEAAAYRECLDTEQATATHDAKPSLAGAFPKRTTSPEERTERSAKTPGPLWNTTRKPAHALNRQSSLMTSWRY
jgi:hypothetical protein